MTKRLIKDVVPPRVFDRLKEKYPLVKPNKTSPGLQINGTTPEEKRQFGQMMRQQAKELSDRRINPPSEE